MKKHIVGRNKKVTGDGWHVVGASCRVIGNNNTVTGHNATVFGHHNNVTGNNAVVNGNHNTGAGNHAVIHGNHNTWTGANCKHYGTDNTLVEPASAPSPPPEKRKQTDICYVDGPTEQELVWDAEAEGEDAPTCVVCLTNAPICVVLPCMHACMCVECARGMCFEVGEVLGDVEKMLIVGTLKCPKCRAVVESIRRLHKE